MARLPRLNIPNISQHVIQRGNNREVCLFADQDYTAYLDKLKEYADKYDVAVHAYVLMTNHVQKNRVRSSNQALIRKIE